MAVEHEADTGSGETRYEKPPSGLPSGVLLKDRYRIDKELGRGGIGAVYLARDEQLEGRLVVVKVLLETSSGNAWLQKKFQDEMKALVRLDHPGIVSALDVGTTADGRPFLVMQHVAGRTLRASLDERPLPPFEEAADIVRQAGAALTAAHERGVFHRDLKPENIMLQDLGHGERLVKIIDFGIATVKESAQAQTALTEIAGTALYMAPEQLAGKPGSASDTYALGVIGFELLTGAPPYRPASPYELLSLQKDGPQRRPSEINKAVPPACDGVLLQALSFDAAKRHKSSRELGEALAAAVGVQPPAGDAASTLAGTPTSRRLAWPGRRVVIGLAGIAALLALTVFMPRWFGPQSTATPSPQPAAPALSPPRELSYAVLVQRFRGGQPYRDPFRLPGAMLFGVDDRIRLLVSSPQAGHLYVLNEGPAAGAQTDSFNILFPSPTANQGSSALVSSQEVAIPEKSWFAFDDAQGTERVWLIWAAERVPELEAVTGYANPKDRGRIADAGQHHAVRAYIRERARSQPEPQVDDEGQRTRLRGKGDVLVSRIELAHR
jgi:hypothetical protein